MTDFGIILCLYEKRISNSNNIVKSWDRDSWEHSLNYSQYIVSDRNEHFKSDLDRNLNL